jgi:5-methyltetrahydrofolate--homocysteine methyltransferase
MSRFLERLSTKKVLIADGATGTMYQAAGLKSGAAPEEWNITNPDKVQAVYRAYLRAGSDIILTNTFGGTSIKLGKFDLADRVKEFNRTSAALAREAAGQEALVMGDLGPTGDLMEPMGTLTYEKAVKAYAEQAEALAEGGVDAILVETMADLSEARAAIEGAKSATELPVVCTMSFDTPLHTMMGVSPRQAMEGLYPLGLAAIGANCGSTLEDTEQVIIQMKEANPQAVLMAKPNAGLPRMEGDRAVYDVTPAEMAEFARRFVELGVKIVGGCCGSTPEHIAAIAAALKT